jgi:hypothetical protein
MPRSTVADLRALAAARDFRIERVTAGADRWRLLDQRGRKVTNPRTRDSEFTATDGLAFLQSLRGVARCPRWQRF